MGIWGKIFSSGSTELVKEVGSVVDNLTTPDEERAAAKQKLEELFKNHEKNMCELEVEDRKSARDMYKDDAFIQKILATLFTVAYFGITFVMFSYFVTKSLDLGEFEISFISTIFGAMSSKVNTIIDFFFGGSAKKQEEK